MTTKIIGKFLFEFEDGSFTQGSSYQQADVDNMKDGYMDILRFHNGGFQILSNEEKWIDIKRLSD